MTPPSPSPEVSNESSSPSQQSPSASPSLLEDPTPSSPLFMPSLSPDQLAETGPESSPSPDASGESGASDPGSSSARRSTGSARQRLRALTATVATAVQTAGGIAHQLLTREGTPERDVQLWVPDEEDVEAISEPLASLASRRMPEGAENPDVTDLVRLALGVVRYVFKQRDKAASIQRYYAPEETAEPAGEPVDL